MITLSNVLVLAAILFCISVAGIFINRKNVIILLMCIELMLLSVNMNFIAFSHFLNDINGQIFVFFIPTWAYDRNFGRDNSKSKPQKSRPEMISSKV